MTPYFLASMAEVMFTKTEKNGKTAVTLVCNANVTKVSNDALEHNVNLVPNHCHVCPTSVVRNAKNIQLLVLL